jgi:hypothetical protein
MLTEEIAVLTAEPPMAEKSDVYIGEFDILATYTYAKAILDGAPVAEAKERGMVAAIMGAQAKLGHTVNHADQKKEAEQKKKRPSPPNPSTVQRDYNATR